jgi:hypothetical protein
MDILDFVLENRIILIPALIILGWFAKNVRVIPDKFIPIILLGFGVALSFWMEMAFTAHAVVQGIMVAGVAVLGNQIPKQLKKRRVKYIAQEVAAFLKCGNLFIPKKNLIRATAG